MSNNAQTLSSNQMGIAPINPLLLKNAIPMMISMLVQALYNVVDSIFVSRIDEAALSAVSLAFPIQNLLIAFAVGTAIGVNAHLSRSLGEQNPQEASRAAMNGIFLSVCSSAAFILFGIFGAAPFIRSQTADAEILRYGCDYLSICCAFSLGCFMQCMLEKVLVSTGRSALAMTSQLVGAVINIILDPIFIFGLFGMPRLEVVGAAVATVTGQFIGAGVALTMNLLLNKDIHLTLKGFRPSGRTIRRIYAVGLPAIAMNAIGSIMTFCMNIILIGFSSTAVAVFGVYFKLQSFVFMPVFGLNNGMVSIVSYNYGARKPSRVVSVVKYAMFYAMVIMLGGFLLSQFLPDKLLGAFNASADMMGMGVVALRIISISFLVAGFNVIATAVFQALGQGMFALWVSVARQLVVLLPAAFLLSLTGRLNLIWWAFPISEAAACLLCAVFLRSIYANTLKPLYAVEEPDCIKA